MRTLLKQLCLAGAVGLGVYVAASGPAWADKRFMCRMKGTWIESKDDFEFDAVYIAKDGPDMFSGKYDNPGNATADIVGNASVGVWTILLTYTDAGHKGMLKKLLGKGAKDPVTHEIVVTGDYKTFIGTSDIKKDGTFRLHGKCR